MVGRMEGKTALITGGGRGIGRTIALAYVREGAVVALSARSEEALEETASTINSGGGRALAVPADVTEDADVANLRSRIERELGQVDVLVNNAGSYLPRRFLDYTMEEWEQTIGVNLLGTVRVTREFLPGMLERGRGRIVNVASTAGKYGSLFQSAYNASKHGVVGLTRCLALETAKTAVRVNAICPGFVETEMIDGAKPHFAEILGQSLEQTEQTLLSRVPIGRFLQPTEVAHLAVYLGSDESDGMTGQALTISGGLILV